MEDPLLKNFLQRNFFDYERCLCSPNRKDINSRPSFLLFETWAFGRGRSGAEEPVHVLAYYSSCGPARCEELERALSSIRDGRYTRARNMLLKLSELKMPLKWEHLMKIAGNGVAPGRLHVARGMVEAGYVQDLKQAFNRYLYDGGPAYAT